MAKESGWWKIRFTTEPSETDLAEIARQITEGYTEGKIEIDEEEEKEPNDKTD